MSDSNSGAFECHLCNRNLASSKMSIASRLSSVASSVVGAPEIKSSTYKLLRISATVLGKRGSINYKYLAMTPFNRNGDEVRPKTTRVKRSTSTSVECKSLIQWNRNASRSASRTLICRKAKARLLQQQQGGIGF